MREGFSDKQFWSSLAEGGFNDESKETLRGIVGELVFEARKVIENSYSPYSKFRVASCVFTDAGKFWGVNVENSSYGLTMCAERNAIFSAVTAGAKEVYAVFIFTDGVVASPCGACRQVIYEFGDSAVVISVALNSSQDFKFWKIKELLPQGFRLK